MTHGLSVRRACALVDMSRATYHYQAHPRADEPMVVQEIATLAQQHPRYGYRRVWALLRRKRMINRKRVHRLWQRARLQVKRVMRRRIRRGRLVLVVACSPNHVWAYDFLEDRLVDGTTLKVLTVMDEYTRKGLDLDVTTTTSAERVIERLARLVARYGAPGALRSDNGPEFIALAVQRWLADWGIQTLYIDPGCPWQNGKEERFNGTVRDECLNLHVFTTVREAVVRLEIFRTQYNEERPQSALRYQTPTEFYRNWV